MYNSKMDENIVVLVLGLVSSSLAANLRVPVQVINDWGGRYQGDIKFTVTEQVVGWEVILNCSDALTLVDEWMGDIINKSADKHVYTIVNKQHTGILAPGETLDIQLFVNYAGTKAPTCDAELINLGHDEFVPATAPPNTDGTKYDLNQVLEYSILFYEAQRSGKLPPNNRIPWRGDSALNDRGDNGEDLTGGWYDAKNLVSCRYEVFVEKRRYLTTEYRVVVTPPLTTGEIMEKISLVDAGDHVKFNFPMAFSVTSLAWGLLEFKDAYNASGQLDYMYESIEWPLDYLMRCHVAPNEFYVQVGDGGKDHSFWGRPEDMTMDRPAYKIDQTHPGSDIAAETAAAFAASYLVFKHRNATFANELLSHAKELFAFAEAHPGKYSDSVNAASAYYRSFNETDEMCWGGAWLYLATQDAHYLDVAKKNYISGAAWGQSWDEKNSGCMVLLYKITQDPKYLADIEATFNDWMPGGSIPYTPDGLAFRSQWGSNRYASNMALIAIMASMQGIHPAEYRKWAESQINLMLGDAGRSFVVGFGKNPPTQPHHRGSSCPMSPAPCASFNMQMNGPNPHVLYGALVGGPDQSGRYEDKRSNYVNNEVACDYNAGFQSAVAGLKALYMRGEMPVSSKKRYVDKL